MALDSCAPWLPPLLAFFACISSGLTAFGDGILFLVMWSILTTAGVVDGTKPTALTQGVLHVMVLSLAPLPYLCWVARQDIRDFFWWACTMALPSGALVPLGMALLFVGNVAVLKAFIGGLFAVFGCVKLWLSVQQASKRRAAHTLVVRVLPMDSSTIDYCTDVDACPADDVLRDESVPDCESAVSMKVNVTATRGLYLGASMYLGPTEPIMENEEEQSSVSRLCVVRIAQLVRIKCSRAFPPISSTHSVTATWFMFLSCGIASGVLSGMLGVGGPPQILSFSVLNVDMDVQRGVRVLVCVVTSVIRLIVFIASPNSILQAADWPVYVGVSVAAVLGTAVGTALRKKANTEFILRCLYILLIVSTATLFPVFSDIQNVAIYCAVLLAYAICLCVLWLKPRWFRCVCMNA